MLLLWDFQSSCTHKEEVVVVMDHGAYQDQWKALHLYEYDWMSAEVSRSWWRMNEAADANNSHYKCELTY